MYCIVVHCFLLFGILLDRAYNNCVVVYPRRMLYILCSFVCREVSRDNGVGSPFDTFVGRAFTSLIKARCSTGRESSAAFCLSYFVICPRPLLRVRVATLGVTEASILSLQHTCWVLQLSWSSNPPAQQASPPRGGIIQLDDTVSFFIIPTTRSCCVPVGGLSLTTVVLIKLLVVSNITVQVGGIINSMNSASRLYSSRLRTLMVLRLEEL